MSGLSGAEFVLLDQRDSLQASTLRLSADDLAQLRQIHMRARLERSGRPAHDRRWADGAI